jgi:hypothetical protein
MLKGTPQLRKHPVELWPSRSPDFTPIDFFLFLHLKKILLRHPINNFQELQSGHHFEHVLQSLTIQGVIEMHGIILTTSYWLHVEFEKNI